MSPFESTCGDNSTAKKILVAYDTKHGSTAGIAAAIGETLCGQGLRADVKLAYAVQDIASYDAVIVGSPLYYSTFLPGALQFLERHKATLAAKKTALFISSVSVDATGKVLASNLNLVKSTVLSKFPDIVFLEPVGLLPGKLVYKETFPVEVIGLRISGFSEGDVRNDGIVRSWAQEIGPLLR